MVVVHQKHRNFFCIGKFSWILLLYSLSFPFPQNFFIFLLSSNFRNEYLFRNFSWVEISKNCVCRLWDDGNLWTQHYHVLLHQGRSGFCLGIVSNLKSRSTALNVRTWQYVETELVDLIAVPVSVAAGYWQELVIEEALRLTWSREGEMVTQCALSISRSLVPCCPCTIHPFLSQEELVCVALIHYGKLFSCLMF